MPQGFDKSLSYQDIAEFYSRLQLESPEEERDNFPRITVLTPSLNQGATLERTILSVLNQNYPNLEYIIIDGGSTDDSLEVIHRYSPYLAHWVSEPDRGQAHAINKGWRLGTGLIYAFINSDDAYLPNVFKQIARIFVSRPQLGLVYGDSMFIDETGKTLGIKRGRQLTYRHLLYRGQSGIIQPTCFFSADAIRSVGFLDESLFMGFDYDYILRVARVAEIKYLPEILALTTYSRTIKSFTYPERFHRENRMIAARQKKGLFLRHRWNGFKFRLLRALPAPIEKLFRRWRNSIEDQILLKDR